MLKSDKKSPRSKKVFRVINPSAAGIDVGAREVYIAVPEDRDPEPVKAFETFTEDLHKAAKWLKTCDVTSIVMESTGVYWIPIFQILESYGFEVLLVNARHVKNVPGRKTDVQDCQWLQYLHSVGLLRGSFRPPQNICAMRSLLRHRDNLVKASICHVQHIHKILTQMNLQIQHVISDITGSTGTAIMDSILAGERDPKKLALYRDRRIKADYSTIVKSLQGDYRPEFLFSLKQVLQLYRNYIEMIEECDREIENQLNHFPSELNVEQERPLPPAPAYKKKKNSQYNFDLRANLYRLIGTDLTQIDGVSITVAHVFFSEVGTNLSKFPTANHFCSWLGLCPKNKISGGRILSSHTRGGKNRLAQALKMAAQSLWKSQSYLGNYFRRMRSKLGSPKAITATAHKLARIIYHLVKNSLLFDETILADQEILYRKRLERRVKLQAKTLGYQLVPIEKV